MILFNHYFSKRTLGFIGVFVLAIALPLILIVVRQRQDVRQRASVGQVMLRLTPDSTSRTTGETVNVATILDASSQNITGVDIRLHFDPNVLELTSGDPAPLFNTELVRSVDNTAGTIRYAAVNTANTTITGTVDLGTLHFRTKNIGSAAITIDVNDASPQIAALGSPTLLAVDTTNTSVEVIPPPTMTPIPTTPSPTPTIQPSPTPTLAPGEPTNTPSPVSPTPTPVTPVTGTPSSTPSPAVGITQTPVPSGTRIPGDADGVGGVTLLDFNIWRDEYLEIVSTRDSDFDGVGGITLFDFNIWKDAYLLTF